VQISPDIEIWGLIGGKNSLAPTFTCYHPQKQLRTAEKLRLKPMPTNCSRCRE
jgi:hypothetical protein